MKTQTSKQILPPPQDTMMSFFTASPTEETSLKSSSNVKMRAEARGHVCAVYARARGFACAHFRLFNDAMNSLCCPVLMFYADGGDDLRPFWLCAVLRWCVPVGVRLFSQEPFCRNLLFSLSHVALFLLFLLPLFPHLLLPCLLNEGMGKFYLHFLEM